MTANFDTRISYFGERSFSVLRPQKIRLARRVMMVAIIGLILFRPNEFLVVLALTFLYILAIFANSNLYRLEKRLEKRLSYYTVMSSYQYNPTVLVVGLIILLCKWIYIFVR